MQRFIEMLIKKLEAMLTAIERAKASREQKEFSKIDIFAHKFDPKTDSISSIKPKSGCVVVCLKEGVSLPETRYKPHFADKKRRVIFVGHGERLDFKIGVKCFGTLHDRETKCDTSSLRASLMAILKSEDEKYLTSEEKLNAWIADNLDIYYIYSKKSYELKWWLIKEQDPPFYLRSQATKLNKKFRDFIEKERSVVREFMNLNALAQR